ncbi:MAG: ABC transporter permease [Oscillospiraceae bacterium]|nr:ABC transporter permease [Oscillospiraceae bacterium]
MSNKNNGNRATKTDILVTKKYRKRSQIGDIFHYLKFNKGAMAGFVIFSLIIVAFLGSLFISWDAITDINVSSRFARPSAQHIFGADNMGRDLFLRVIYGTRYSLAIGFGAVLISAFIGVVAGSFAGYYGGKADDIIMRLSDVLASIPGILMGMVIVTVMGQSLINLIVAVGITGAPVYLRMTRASILTVRNNEFVEAAKAVGIANLRIIFTQVLPNGLSPVIVTVTAGLGITIIVASSLSFLGFGVPVPHPEWGAVIAAGREYTRNAPWITTFPGIFIMMTVLAFNLFGDGVRDALDPKLKRR